MARLGFGGYDFGSSHADGGLTVARQTWAASADSVDATVTRSGRGLSAKFTATAGSAGTVGHVFALPAASTGVNFYVRVAVRFPAFPDVATTLLQSVVATAPSSKFRLNADGTIAALSASNAVLGSTPVALDTWHILEIRVVGFATNGSGASQGQWADLRVNGQSLTGGLVNVSTQSGSPASFRWGIGEFGGTINLASNWVVYMDDWAVNNDAGAADNAWVGTEQTALLLPASDNAIGSRMTLGAGGAPSGAFYDSLNNTPPTGKGSSVANGDQVRDTTAPTGVTADEAVVNLQTYSAGGVPTGAFIKLVLLVAEIAPTTTTTPGPTAGASLVANPAIAEATGTGTTSTPSAYPLGWTRVATSFAATPSVALGTAPVAKLRYVTAAGTGGLYACALGAYVAFEPPQAITAAGAIASEEGVGHPVVGQTAFPQMVVASGLASAEAIGTPAVTPAAVTVAPTGIASRQAFGAAKVTRFVSPTAIASAEAIGSPTVALVGLTVHPEGIASGEAAGTPGVAGPVTVAGIASTETFGTPEILGQVRPPGLPSREAVGTPQITGGYHRYDFVPASAPQTTTNGVTRDFPITLSGLGSVKDVEVSLYLTNPGGLAGNAVTLIAPNGQSVALIPNNGGGNRTATGAGTADQQRTHFDSEAAVAWGSLSTAPWVGRFRPSGNLAALNGTDPNGVWRLRVADRKQGNTVNTIRVATLLLDVVAPLVPQTIAPPAIAPAEAFGAATVGGPLLPSAIASREAVGEPVVQSVVQFAVVFGLAIASREAIGTPVVSGPVTPTSVASTQAVGTPTVDLGAAAQLTIIDAGAIASAEGVGAATLTQTATVILPVGIPSGETFGEAAPVLPPWVVVPPAPDGSTAPGSGPVVGPAPTGRRASWLRDPFTNYNWPLNHSAESAVTVTRASSRGAPRLDVGFARQQEPAEPLVLRLEGVLLDPAQLAALENFYDRCGLWPVVFHDADGDEYEVIITAFDAHRVRGYNPHTHGSSYWRYSMQLDVLRALAGAYQVIA